MANKRKLQKTETKTRSRVNPKKIKTTNTLEDAFRRASLGRDCPICEKRVQLAVYNRHMDSCKISEESDEIQFCGIFQSTSSCADNKARRNRSVQKKIERDEQQKEGPETSRLSRTVNNNVLSQSTFAATSKNFPVDQSSSSTHSTKDKFATVLNAIDDENETSNCRCDLSFSLTLREVYELCLHSLEKLLGEHESAIKQTNCTDDNWTAPAIMDENSNSTMSYSQKIHNEIDANWQGIKRNSVHYSLLMLWKVIKWVLLCPEHKNPADAVTFWGDSLRVIYSFLTASMEEQQLFAQLLKRRWGWHMVKNTQSKYQYISGDHSKHFDRLSTAKLMETGSKSEERCSLKDALNLLRAQDFLPLCKKFKLNHSASRPKLIERIVNLAKQPNLLGGTVQQHILSSIRDIIGEFYRIAPDALKVFTAFLTVYSPMQMDTKQLSDPQTTKGELASQLIFYVLQSQNNNMKFSSPKHFSNTLIGVLGNYAKLAGYVEAKSWEEKIIRLGEKSLFEEALSSAKWAKSLLSDFTQTDFDFYRELPVFQRKFTAPWVLCRCVFLGIEVAQKLRNYPLAVEWLRFLLERDEIRCLCPNSRGTWYNRLALNLERYMKEREQSISVCLAGMGDELVGEADKLLLQNRLVKTSNRLDILSQKSLLFTLTEPEVVTITGRTLAKGLGDGEKVNHFYVCSSDPNRGEISKCSVEQLALRHFFEEQGFSEGVYSEGQIWHTVFRLLFHDIIFSAEVEGVWISPLQDDPLDLHYSDFYAKRKTAIDQRLQDILSADDTTLFANQYFDRMNSNLTSNSAIGYYHFHSARNIARFLKCCSPRLLHGLCKRLCLDYRTRSGFPDLTVWSADKDCLAVIEVKGPNDALSSKQQLWLDFFRSQGVRAVLCKVTAKKDRALD